MTEMFRYLTGILSKEEQRDWKILAVVDFISPATDIINFSMLIYIINFVMREQQEPKRIAVFTFFIGMISVLKGPFDLYKCKIYNRFVYNGSQRLSEKLCELLLKEDLLHHNQKSPMQALSLVRNDTLNCMKIIVTIIDIWVHVCSMALYFGVMIYASKGVGIISCAAFVLLMGGMFFYYRDQIQLDGDKSRAYGIEANAQVTIAYGNFKEMKIAGDFSNTLQKYCEAGENYSQVQKQFQYKKSIISMIMKDFVMTAMFVILACFLIRPGEGMNYFLASMVIYLTMLIKMIPVAFTIVSGLNDVKFAQKSYEVVKEGMTWYAEIKRVEKEEEKVRKKKLTLNKGLFVKDLTFSYNERKDIFKNSSIDIPTGCSVAVIGVSGIGKTTFLDLILGLLTPQAGHIFFDDYDIVTHMDKTGICRANIGDIVSYIPQTIYLNGETICNNVCFLGKEKEADIARVTECLKCAQVWEDVMQMPEGIHTLIGENGTDISGGQRQRIALARALYKDFELLVMDEATAALDMETEKAVIDSIRQVKGDKTILIVTHHMSLANECDIVYKIENMGFVRVK